jgi:hypothetical protein
MILNWTRRFLFVHVPRTAGTAATLRLLTASTPGDICISHPSEAIIELLGQNVCIDKHHTAAQLLSILGEMKFSSLFKFGFVRNPYTHIYSIYRFLKFNHRAWPGSNIMNRFRSFDDFVASDFFQTPGPHQMFRPQSFWLCGEDGRLLVDHIARWEDFDTEMAAICRRPGIDNQGKMAPVNVSEGESGLPVSMALLVPKLRRRRLLPRAVPQHVNLAKVYARENTLRVVQERYQCSLGLFGYSHFPL